MHIANYIDPGTTDRLISELFRTDNVEEFLRAHAGELVVPSFAAYITRLCKQKKMTVSSALDKADIGVSFGYALFNGSRKPSRDTVIKLAVAFGLNLDETQKLLSAAGFGGLYPKIKRDAVIIYAIQRGYTLYQTQDQLSRQQLTELGEANNERR